MAEEFELPPDANPITVTATFSADEVAYLKGWYQDMKRDDENVEQFLRRLVITTAYQYRQSKIGEQLRQEAEAAQIQAIEQNQAKRKAFRDFIEGKVGE